MNVRTHSLPFRQVGMGLIELMVGMAVGLILLVSLGYFFLGSRQTGRVHDDVSRIQESGRIALDILGKSLRQAGARGDVDAAFPGVQLTGTDGANDTVTARYVTQEDGDLGCTGAAQAGNTLAATAFAVNAARQLTCNGVAVVDNVEGMQLTYGIDADHNGVVESYVGAASVADFTQVVAVRVELLLRGPTPRTAEGSQTFTYGGVAVTRNDGFLRRVFSSTYTLRNQAA